MAWPDGSRFLVATGVKWGDGPRIYTGPSADTPWNHDLNWKDYVAASNKGMAEAAQRIMVRTPAPDGTINAVVHPDACYVYRNATEEESIKINGRLKTPMYHEHSALAALHAINAEKVRAQMAREPKISDGTTRNKISGPTITTSEALRLSSAGRNMVAALDSTGPAVDERPRGGLRSRGGASRAGMLSRSGSRVMTPTGGGGGGGGSVRGRTPIPKELLAETRETRREVHELKDSILRQQASQASTERKMELLVAEMQKLTGSVKVKAAPRGRKK